MNGGEGWVRRVVGGPFPCPRHQIVAMSLTDCLHSFRSVRLTFNVIIGVQHIHNHASTFVRLQHKIQSQFSR